MPTVMIHFEDQRGRAIAQRQLEDDGDPPIRTGSVIPFKGRQYEVVSQLEDKRGEAQYVARLIQS